MVKNVKRYQKLVRKEGAVLADFIPTTYVLPQVGPSAKLRPSCLL
jgi:hypothetical protein